MLLYKQTRSEKWNNKNHLNPIQNKTCLGRDDFYVGSIITTVY